MIKSERQSVRDELYDHLMCRYETNLAVGMGEKTAAESAISDLGDKNTLRFKLSQVHSYYPKLSMKKAMNLLIFGYIFMHFHFSFFTGMKEITSFIGTVCTIIALYCLGKANKKIKASFYIKSVASVFSCIVYAIEPIYSLPFMFTAVCGIISSVLTLFYFVFAILGLKELVEPYNSVYTKKIPFGLSIFFNLIIGIFNTIILILLLLDGETSTDIQSTLLFIVTIFMFIVDLVVLIRSSKLLWQSDHEYKIEDSSKKKVVAAIVAIAVAVVPTVAVDISLANQKAVTSVYSIEDYDMSQDEYERICNKILAYGIPEKVVDSMPKSEIANYTDCFEITEYSQREQSFMTYKNYYYMPELFSDGTHVAYSSVLFEIKEPEGRSHYRILSWIDYSAGKRKYDDSFYFIFNDNAFTPLNYSGEYNDNFLLIMSEEDGRLIRNEPLDVYTDKTALTDNITGVRFESKENLLIVHAVDFNLGKTSYLGNDSDNYIEFIHRNSVVSFPFRSSADVKKYNINGELGYASKQIYGMVHVPMPYEKDEYKDVTILEVTE